MFSKEARFLHSRRRSETGSGQKHIVAEALDDRSLTISLMRYKIGFFKRIGRKLSLRSVRFCDSE